MYPLPKENRDEQIFIGLAAGRPGGRAGHHLSRIQLTDRRCATYVEYGSTSWLGSRRDPVAGVIAAPKAS
jgi:hypothetical protein